MLFLTKSVNNFCAAIFVPVKSRAKGLVRSSHLFFSDLSRSFLYYKFTNKARRYFYEKAFPSKKQTNQNSPFCLESFSLLNKLYVKTSLRIMHYILLFQILFLCKVWFCEKCKRIFEFGDPH